MPEVNVCYGIVGIFAVRQSRYKSCFSSFTVTVSSCIKLRDPVARFTSVIMCICHWHQSFACILLFPHSGLPQRCPEELHLRNRCKNQNEEESIGIMVTREKDSLLEYN